MTTTRDVYDYYGEGRPSTIFYDLIEDMCRPIESEVAFYLGMSKFISTPILEIGCGTGRITWSLAEAGHEVLGLDIAAAMLERAQKKNLFYPDDVTQRVHFLLGDACSVTLKRRFDLVLAPYRVFNHLPTLVLQRCFLANIRRHLSPRGRLVFDTTEPTPERLLANRHILLNQEAPVIDIPHLGITLEHRIIDTHADVPNQTLVTDFCYTMKTTSGGTYAHVDRLVLRWVSPPELRLMLEQAGFRVLSEHQNFDESSPNGSGDRIWVAEAAGG